MNKFLFKKCCEDCPYISVDYDEALSLCADKKETKIFCSRFVVCKKYIEDSRSRIEFINQEPPVKDLNPQTNVTELICPICGTMVHENEHYCPHCGNHYNIK